MTRSSKALLVTLAISFVLSSIVPVGIACNVAGSTTSISHPMIHIDNDTDLSRMAAIENWAGDGSDLPLYDPRL